MGVSRSKMRKHYLKKIKQKTTKNQSRQRKHFQIPVVAIASEAPIL